MARKISHCVRTLRLKVKPGAYARLNTAATEVNQVWNYANATSYKAARPYSGRPRWLTAFDLDKLTAGATKHFDRIGSETIQRVNAELQAGESNSRKQNCAGESVLVPSCAKRGGGDRLRPKGHRSNE